MRGCQKREAICKHDLVTLGIIRIGRLVSEAVENEAEQALSVSNKEDHLAGQTYSQGNVKVGTFFEAHQSTWLLKVSGEPFGRFSSFIKRRARPLPHRDVIDCGVFRSERDLQWFHSGCSDYCKMWRSVNKKLCL